MQRESFINKEILKSLKDSPPGSVFPHKIAVKWSYSELAFYWKVEKIQGGKKNGEKVFFLAFSNLLHSHSV